MLNGLKSMVLV